jgi:hypothetical protein
MTFKPGDLCSILGSAELYRVVKWNAGDGMAEVVKLTSGDANRRSREQRKLLTPPTLDAIAKRRAAIEMQIEQTIENARRTWRGELTQLVEAEAAITGREKI